MAETLREYLAELEAEVRRLRNKLDNVRGPGVVNTPTSLAINFPAPPRQISQASANLPTPQEEYTVYQGIGNNKAAFAPFRSHPPLS